MRKVSNRKNDAVLRKLGDDFVMPLLRALVNAKQHACQVHHTQAMSGLSKPQEAVLKAAFKIPVGKGKKKRSFGVRCNAVVKALTLAELQVLPNLYQHQVASLQGGNYSLGLAVVPKSVVNLFKDVIYGELMDDATLWTALGVAVFSRAQFHNNFMDENDHPSTCPYCDLDTINSKGSRFVEHFLPKSKFPLLAVEAQNLFSACVACNGPSGKQFGWQPNVTSPYAKEIGELVEFSFNDRAETLGISAQQGLNDVDGYLRLLKLRARYSDKTVWKQFQRRRDAITESVGHRKPGSRDELLAYVESQQRAAVLTYAVRYWADVTLAPALASAVATPAPNS
ncbi:HNH endonuclease family protein [Paraburkholderia bannensis]|uniref:hypothetical protein n=1 Tax=Paraburkholderia bannensis TaxID=765414 RepID=UPI002AB7767A|nr:hypothetical protein [Paraburkholderia bannensis]